MTIAAVNTHWQKQEVWANSKRYRFPILKRIPPVTPASLPPGDSYTRARTRREASPIAFVESRGARQIRNPWQTRSHAIGLYFFGLLPLSEALSLRPSISPQIRLPRL